MKHIDAERLCVVSQITLTPARRSTARIGLKRESAWGAAMSPTDTLLRDPLPRCEGTAPGAFVSLIEVPDVKRGASRRLRVTGARRWDRGRPSRGPARRKLRHEVKVAGCALLALAPLLAASTLRQSDRPARVLACSIAEARSPDRVSEIGANPVGLKNHSLDTPLNYTGDVVLSSGAAAPADATDPEVPVVFHGYVLPDDSHEESTHEGS